MSDDRSVIIIIIVVVVLNRRAFVVLVVGVFLVRVELRHVRCWLCRECRRRRERVRPEDAHLELGDCYVHQLADSRRLRVPARAVIITMALDLALVVVLIIRYQGMNSTPLRTLREMPLSTEKWVWRFWWYM